MLLLLIFLALLIVFMILPICAEISCKDGKASVSVRLSKIPIYLYPKRNKSEKKKKEKKLELKDKLEIAKILRRTLKRVFHRFKLSKLKLRFISAGDDPYDVVMRYDNANAIAGFFYPFTATENRDIDIRTDFEAEKSEFSAFLELKIRIYQLVSISPDAAKILLKIFFKQRKMKVGKQTQ